MNFDKGCGGLPGEKPKKKPKTKEETVADDKQNKQDSKILSGVTEAQERLLTLGNKLKDQDGVPKAEDIKEFQAIQSFMGNLNEKYPSPKAKADGEPDATGVCPKCGYEGPFTDGAKCPKCGAALEKKGVAKTDGQPPDNPTDAGRPPTPPTTDPKPVEWPKDMAGKPSDSKDSAIHWGHTPETQV